MVDLAIDTQTNQNLRPFECSWKSLILLAPKPLKISRGVHEQQIWQVILREILNLCLNAKICIFKKMALFLYVFRLEPCF